jgi:hypothetical protein
VIDYRAPLTALLIPADPRRSCALLALRESSVEFSDAIGGGLLDEAYHGSVDGQGYCVYLDDERLAKALPENPRAVFLAARLAWIDQVDRIGLRGDALLVGTGLSGEDADLPEPVLHAARRTGLLPDPA